MRRAALESGRTGRWCEARYDARRARYADLIPPIAPDQRAILAELADAGVATREVDLPAHVLAAASRFAGLLAARRTDTRAVRITPEQLAADPDVYTYGLSEHMLDLAEAHVGLPVHYLGLEVKREKVSGTLPPESIRQWHLDHEDRRILKLIVYLSDVDEGSGPFGWIHRSHAPAVLVATGGKRLATVSDTAMDAIVPSAQWHQVTGPRMTGVYVDTGQVYHRVFAPRERERYSMTFGYCSSRPYYTYWQLRLPPAAMRALRPSLTERQRAALGG